MSGSITTGAPAIMAAVQALDEPINAAWEAVVALQAIADFGQSNGLDADQCRGLRFAADIALERATTCRDGWRKLHGVAGGRDV